MALLGHVVGGAAFGLTARFWQLGILRRPMMSNPYGHVVCMGVFGYTGYWWWRATEYMQGVLTEKEAELRVRRQMIQAKNEALLQRELESPSEAQA
ncbi:hypothetical protein C8R44DRAFT_873986 [Mycena epipterygia]|nr:hypothetical protein C8R44DRAFT_873986 [Mycena epipterygia]